MLTSCTSKKITDQYFDLKPPAFESYEPVDCENHKSLFFKIMYLVHFHKFVKPDKINTDFAWILAVNIWITQLIMWYCFRNVRNGKNIPREDVWRSFWSILSIFFFWGGSKNVLLLKKTVDILESFGSKIPILKTVFFFNVEFCFSGLFVLESARKKTTSYGIVSPKLCLVFFVRMCCAVGAS